MAPHNIQTFLDQRAVILKMGSQPRSPIYSGKLSFINYKIYVTVYIYFTGLLNLCENALQRVKYD